MKNNSNKKESVRYVLFALTFLFVLALIVVFILLVNNFEDGYEESKVTKVTENRQEEEQDADTHLIIDIETGENITHNLSGNTLE